MEIKVIPMHAMQASNLVATLKGTLRTGGEVSCWYRINKSEDYSNEIQVP